MLATNHLEKCRFNTCQNADIWSQGASYLAEWICIWVHILFSKLQAMASCLLLLQWLAPPPSLLLLTTKEVWCDWINCPLSDVSDEWSTQTIQIYVWMLKLGDDDIDCSNWALNLVLWMRARSRRRTYWNSRPSQTNRHTVQVLVQYSYTQKGFHVSRGVHP